MTKREMGKRIDETGNGPRGPVEWGGRGLGGSTEMSERSTRPDDEDLGPVMIPDQA
jgi:hypothetical protein